MSATLINIARTRRLAALGTLPTTPRSREDAQAEQTERRQNRRATPGMFISARSAEYRIAA